MTTSKSITIDGTDFPFEVIRNKRAKNGKIYVRHNKVEIVAPPFMPLFMVRDIIKSHHGWILERQAALLERRAASPLVCPEHYISGEQLTFRGEACEIDVIETDKVRIKIAFEEKLTIYAPSYLEGKERHQAITKQLVKWLREEARDDVYDAIDHYSPLLSLRPKNVAIKDQKRCWGSCSGKENININWRLVLAAPEVLNYVVLHELCHLEHMNHSKEFWALVEEHMPNYKVHKQWLKEYGAFLKDACGGQD